MIHGFQKLEQMFSLLMINLCIICVCWNKKSRVVFVFWWFFLAWSLSFNLSAICYQSCCGIVHLETEILLNVVLKHLQKTIWNWRLQVGSACDFLRHFVLWWSTYGRFFYSEEREYQRFFSIFQKRQKTSSVSILKLLKFRKKFWCLC